MENNDPSSSRNTEQPTFPRQSDQNLTLVPAHTFNPDFVATTPDLLIPPIPLFPVPVSFFQMFFQVLNDRQFLVVISHQQGFPSAYQRGVYVFLVYDLEQNFQLIASAILSYRSSMVRTIYQRLRLQGSVIPRLHMNLPPQLRASGMRFYSSFVAHQLRVHRSINQPHLMHGSVRPGLNVNPPPQLSASGMPYFTYAMSTGPRFYRSTNLVWSFTPQVSSAPEHLVWAVFLGLVWLFTANLTVVQPNSPMSSDQVLSWANPSTRQITFQMEEGTVVSPEAQASTATQERQANFHQAPGAESERTARLSNESNTEDTGAETETETESKTGREKSADPEV